MTTHLRKVVEALKLASPYCLAARYDNLTHCIETSVSAAAALRRRNIRARAIPCAVSVKNPDGNMGMSIGLTPQFLYDHLKDDGTPKQLYEEWKAQYASGVPDVDVPVHMVVDARLGSERAIIDLTIGQLATVANAPLPLQLATVRPVGDGKWWPGFGHSGWEIDYMDSPLPPALLDPVMRDAKLYEKKNSGFVADLHDSIEFALHCGLDVTRYRLELRRQKPVETEALEAKILSWMGPA